VTSERQANPRSRQLRACTARLARGIEGYVGKHPSSTYLAGGPTRSWLKAKVRREGQFIVGGVVERSEGWSLLLGTIEGGRLQYRGLVHWGVRRCRWTPETA